MFIFLLCPYTYNIKDLRNSEMLLRLGKNDRNLTWIFSICYIVISNKTVHIQAYVSSIYVAILNVSLIFPQTAKYYFSFVAYVDTEKDGE
jgi:hypothetical protein